MAYFSIGDKVHVRMDLKEKDENGFTAYYYMEGHTDFNVATDLMCDMAGEEVEIENVARGQYQIRGNEFDWTDEMFEEYVRPDTEFEIDGDESIDLLF